jgi:pimeloyl-ACP methyl ester carboxylesterase
VASATGTILLLHEALGSVSYWKDFPHKLAIATGANVLLYARPGHGNSEGPLEPRDEKHYADQVEVVIPALLRHFDVRYPIVYGHSEGAAIAMLFAGVFRQAKALILESPIVIPGRQAAQLIERMADAYPGSKLQNRLGQYHRDPDGVFYSWVSWARTLSDDDHLLPNVLAQIVCPTLVLQGASDEFGLGPQLRAIQSAIPQVQHRIFPETGHLPHREQTDLVLSSIREFLADIRPSAGREPVAPYSPCEDSR